MTADEIFEGRMWRGRSRRSGNDAVQVCAAQDGGEAIEHAMSGFANSEDADIWEASKIIGAIQAAELVAGDRKTAFDGSAGIDGCECTMKNLAGEMFAIHWLEV